MVELAVAVGVDARKAAVLPVAEEGEGLPEVGARRHAGQRADDQAGEARGHRVEIGQELTVPQLEPLDVQGAVASHEQLVAGHVPDAADEDVARTRPPLDRLRVDPLVDVEEPAPRVGDVRHLVEGQREGAPFELAGAGHRQAEVGAPRPHGLPAGEAVGDVAGLVGVEEVVGGGDGAEPRLELGEGVAGVERERAVEGFGEVAALGAAEDERPMVRAVEEEDGAMHGGEDVLGDDARWLPRGGRLHHVRLGAHRHVLEGAVELVLMRVVGVELLDVGVHLVACVARDQRPRVLVAPADADEGAEPRHGEPRAVDAGPVEAELVEDRGREESRLWRPEQQAHAGCGAPPRGGDTVAADLRQRQPGQDRLHRVQQVELEACRRGDARKQRQAHLRGVGRGRRQLARRRWRPLAERHHRGSVGIVRQEQVVPVGERLRGRVVRHQVRQQRRVLELAARALAGEGHHGEQHQHRHRVLRPPQVGLVAERGEKDALLRRVGLLGSERGVEAVGEGLEHAPDIDGQRVVLCVDIGRVVKLAAHRLVGDERGIVVAGAEYLRETTLGEAADDVGLEEPVGGERVAGAEGHRLAGVADHVGDAEGIAGNDHRARPGERERRRTNKHEERQRRVHHEGFKGGAVTGSRRQAR